MAVATTLKGRDFLTIHGWSRDELTKALDLADEQKAQMKAGQLVQPLRGKTLGMIFAKASTRTRLSFEVGMFQLGGHALFLSGNDLQLRRGESIPDTARVFSRYVDGIMIRTFAQADVEELAAWASIPVINGLTDLHHPCQILADLMTIREKKGTLSGLKLAFVGDGNNMAHSLMEGGAKFGMHVVIACPEVYAHEPAIVARARMYALASGAGFVLVHAVGFAAAGAVVVYTVVWASMGQEAEAADRKAVFAPFQVNSPLMDLAHGDAIFMHCLPAHRGEDVTDAVIDGPQSVVFDEAENRLHAQKALLTLLI